MHSLRKHRPRLTASAGFRSRSGRLTFADTVGQVLAGCADADYTVRVFPGAPLGLLHKYHRDATGTGVVTLKYPPPILPMLRGQRSKAAGVRPRALMLRDAGALSRWLGINRFGHLDVCKFGACRVSVIPQAPTSATAIDANRHVARSLQHLRIATAAVPHAMRPPLRRRLQAGQCAQWIQASISHTSTRAAAGHGGAIGDRADGGGRRAGPVGRA